ncbi:MAG: PKD domain-containing protein [Methanomassiliicoccales archaeon]|nr:MAG: PKD domain-containing protein [Methanomassiliicoccales archaeon]
MRKLVVVLLLILMATLTPGAEAYKEIDGLNSSFSTHQFIFDQAVTILANDGFSDLTSFIEGAYLEQLKWGSVRADDTLWDSREHYMDPFSHEGLLGFKSAGQLAGEKFSLAVSYWASGNKLEAMYNLGWSAHMVADLTVPHHARLTFLDYHSEYEQWVLDHQNDYAVNSGGIYIFGIYLPDHYEVESDPFDWVDYNSHKSYELFEYVNGPDGQDDNDYGHAASILLPRAQRTTAGYLLMFFKTVDEMPIASGGGTRIVDEDTLVHFDASGSSDDLGIVNYTWDFGDGYFGFTASHAHIYYDPGVYHASLKVRDALGNEDSVTFGVYVDDTTSPSANAGIDIEGVVGAPILFSGADSSDNVGVVDYNWDFGDGNSASGEMVEHTYNRSGNYVVTLEVRDGEDNTGTDQINVVIKPQPARGVSLEFVFLTIGAIVAIAGGIFCLFIVKRRSRNNREE